MVRDFDKIFNETIISLPFNEKNEIDFKYIEQYIREVEEQYIREVDDYLKVIGYSTINDCQLSEKDKNIIRKKVEFKSFKLCELFDKVNTKKINYTVKTVPRIKSKINSIPVTCSSSMNNSIAGYVPKEGITVLKNMISVCSNGSCRAFYQKNEFSILQDSYALKYKGENQSENVYLYLLSSLSLLLRKYNWSNKPGWNKIKNEIVCIPYNYKDDEIDSSYMEKYIEVIKKIKVLKLREKIDSELELLKEVL